MPKAELIRQWQPWAKSTGPQSAAGKASVSRNAFKGGHWRELRDLIVRTNDVLREQKRLLETISPDDAAGGGA